MTEARDLPGFCEATGRPGVTNAMAKALAYMPMVFNATVTAGEAADVVEVIEAPVDMKIVDAWLIARDTTASNFTLKNGTDAITGATAKGTADDTRVQFATLVAENDVVAAGDSVNVLISANTASADITLVCVPV